MKLTCPHCDYSRTIDPQQIPGGTVQVKCPLCTKTFDLTPQQVDQPAAEQPPSPVTPEQSAATAVSAEPRISNDHSDAGSSAQSDSSHKIRCNSCGTMQHPGSQCINCGALLITTASAVDALPKAGFLIRVVATLVDAFIVFSLQFVLGSILAVAGTVTTVGAESGAGETAFLVHFFSYVVSFAYYIFFTGYCGQTPGKMALRIKVIRTDGAPIGYGRAAFREVPAKFLSGIIFGIGYLMVAFDEKKRGLHDRMADTYVIKL